MSKDKIIICEFSLIIFERSFTGRKPPDDIKVKARFNESKDLIEKILRTIKIIRVKLEYRKNIFIACFKISELLKEIKFDNLKINIKSALVGKKYDKL